MSTSLELAQRLEAARLASGLTRQQLTEQAGVSRQAVYRLFKGNDVQVSTLLAVMDVLQLDLATVPRALKRALPELSLSEPAVAMTPIRGKAGAAPPSAMPPVSPVPPVSPSAHVLSAVQQRLAGLKKSTASAPPASSKGRK